MTRLLCTTNQEAAERRGVPLLRECEAHFLGETFEFPSPRSSSTEVRIRVPFLLSSILVRELSQPNQGRERALLGDLVAARAFTGDFSSYI